MIKIKCSKCGQRPARIHPVYGPIWCAQCSKKSKFEHHGKSVKEFLEYIGTPFWRHMGLKPKPEELAQEKMMKLRGLTYGDLQKIRNEKAKFDSTKLKNKLYRRELPKYGEVTNYRK